MPKNDVATLSPAGFLSTPAEKADALMAHAAAADKSQTRLFGSQVMSLAWLFERHSADLMDLTQAIRQGYSTLFSRHFDDVDVEVYMQPTRENNDNILTLRLSIRFSQDGKRYSVAQELYGLNGKFHGTQKVKEQGLTS